jgi:hypothetical protein
MTGLSNAGYKVLYASWHTEPISNEEILVSPVVSLDDIEQQLQMPPATEHVIASRGPVELYRGADPGTWLQKHGAIKRADSTQVRCTEVDGWYELPPERIK